MSAPRHLIQMLVGGTWRTIGNRIDKADAERFVEVLVNENAGEFRVLSPSDTPLLDVLRQYAAQHGNPDDFDRAIADVAELIGLADRACSWIEEVAAHAAKNGDLVRGLRAVLDRSGGAGGAA